MLLLTRYKSLRFNCKTVYLTLQAGRISMATEIWDLPCVERWNTFELKTCIIIFPVNRVFWHHGYKWIRGRKWEAMNPRRENLTSLSQLSITPNGQDHVHRLSGKRIRRRFSPQPGSPSFQHSSVNCSCKGKSACVCLCVCMEETESRLGTMMGSGTVRHSELAVRDHLLCEQQRLFFCFSGIQYVFIIVTLTIKSRVQTCEKTSHTCNLSVRAMMS